MFNPFPFAFLFFEFFFGFLLTISLDASFFHLLLFFLFFLTFTSRLRFPKLVEPKGIVQVDGSGGGSWSR